jgi:thymidylate synthase
LVGSGQTTVVTGWTVKQAIAKHLHSYEYAVIGQSYSPTRGINLLIRNLLANPHVRFLVVLNATKEDKNAGASQCLLDFFEQGFQEGRSDTGKPSWIICSRIPGYIDLEVDRAALEQLRQSLIVKEVQSISEAVIETRNFASVTQQPWGSPRAFPMPRVTPSVLPGNRYGHRIEGKTIAETWVKIIHRIKTTGTIRATNYDGQWSGINRFDGSCHG